MPNHPTHIRPTPNFTAHPTTPSYPAQMIPAPIPATPAMPHFSHPSDPYDNPVIHERSIAGVQSWPAHLLLSQNANNWLDWSCKLMSSLQTIQLDEYPLGLLRCLDPQVDPTGQHDWRGNDHMILGYMWSHMQALETQLIAHCGTSVEAYSILHLHHKKCSGLTQIQLIQRMMQIHFDNNPNTFDTTMSQLHHIMISGGLDD